MTVGTTHLESIRDDRQWWYREAQCMEVCCYWRAVVRGKGNKHVLMGTVCVRTDKREGLGWNLMRLSPTKLVHGCQCVQVCMH